MFQDGKGEMANQTSGDTQSNSISAAKVLRMCLLSPFAIVYGLGVWLRNKLFDLKILESRAYSVPIICVGNLELGGSGKTPMSDWLIQKLHKKYKIAYLSRGYKRKSKGPLLANAQHSIDDLGDEPYLIFQRWNQHIQLVVDADRRRGIELITHNFPEVNLIILDDGYQHRWVLPKINILLTPFSNPFYFNFLLPVGTLRDEKSQYKRADLVVFSRSPAFSNDLLNDLKQHWNHKELMEKPLFMSSIQYLQPVNWKGEILPPTQKLTAIAGLANNEPFFSKIKLLYTIDQFVSKPDHYAYLPGFFAENQLETSTIITTEKDFYKLLQVAPDRDRIYYLPICIEIFPEVSFIQAIESQL